MQPPTWTSTLEGDVKWMKQTSTGLLIAYSGKGLFGIDPATRRIVWQTKWDASVSDLLANTPLTADGFQEIDGSPYARLQEDSDKLLARSHTSIIDFTTGREVFSSKGKPMKIFDNYPMFSIGAMLLQIREAKKDYLTLLDIATGQERWRIELQGLKHGMMGSMVGYIKKKSGLSQHPPVPVLDKEGNILYPQGETLSRLNGKTGATLWTAKFDERVGRLEFSEKGDVVYAGAGKYIMGHSLSTGAATWKDPYKVPGKFNYFVPLSNNSLLVVTESGITRIDETSGKSVWKKPNYVDLPLQTVEFLPTGMLVLSSSDKESQFDFIDYNGKDLWKRSYKTDKPVTTYELTEKGLLFANAEEANVIDWTDGRDDIWKRRIKLRGTPVVSMDREHSAMLIYSNDKLYTVNLNDLSNKLLAEDIKFRGNNEDVELIETRKDGYLLSSNQNVWFVSFDGKTKFNKFYREVGAGKRALAILGQAASTYGTVAGAVNMSTQLGSGVMNTFGGEKGAADANFRSASNNIYLMQGSTEANTAFTTMLNDRHKASFGTHNAVFIMTGVEEGGVKRTGLMKVDKDTGAELVKIMLKDQAPVYVVDDVANSLYVIVDGNKFYSYQL
ncbi:PQQ-binding-like beta-propeller repeat protein [Fibrella sp. USSR17]